MSLRRLSRVPCLDVLVTLQATLAPELCWPNASLHYRLPCTTCNGLAPVRSDMATSIALGTVTTATNAGVGDLVWSIKMKRCRRV